MVINNDVRRFCDIVNGVNRETWHLGNILHRDGDLPAVKYSNGTNCWYSNGVRHRVNGPAIEWANGDKCWYFNGVRHRENGLPAVKFANGVQRWYLNGNEYFP
jgi:hypothetical protein